MQEIKQEKSPIKQRILHFLACKGVSPYEFYKNSGVTRGVLAQNNGISEDNLSRFITYFPTVNITWLVTGQGEMEVEQNFTSKARIKHTQEILHTESLPKIVSELVTTIQKQAETIGEQRREISELKRQLQTGSDADDATSPKSALA